MISQVVAFEYYEVLRNKYNELKEQYDRLSGVYEGTYDNCKRRIKDVINLRHENESLKKKIEALKNTWKMFDIEKITTENEMLKRKVENQKTEIKNLEKAYRKEKDIRKTDQIHWGRQKKEFNEIIANLKAQLGRKDCSLPIKEDQSQVEMCEVSGAKLGAFNAQSHDFDCKDLGKNELFLSQPLESIINHKFIIKELGGFNIGDFTKCKRSTVRTILRDRLLLTNPVTWDVDIKRVMNLIDETLSKYGLKFSE